MSITRAQVERATVNDAAALSAFGEKTFRSTFGEFNDPGDMDAYVAITYSEELQRREIEDPANDMLLVRRDSRIIAYALLKERECEFHPGIPAVEISRFYVDPSAHGTGLGSTMMSAAFEAAAARRAEIVWLGVWEHNFRAIAFYDKWKFERVGTKRFILGRDVQTDFIVSQRVGS